MKKMMLLMTLLMTAATLFADVTVETKNKITTATGTNYVARIDADGCLSSMKLGGQEMLNAKVLI